MKKIFLCIAICLVAVFAAQASDKEQIAGLIDTIKKAPAGSIMATNVSVIDDCRHVKINKDGKQFLYERACFSVGLRLKGFDPVKYANYRFTVYNDDGTETEIKGDHSKFKELIDVIPEPK